MGIVFSSSVTGVFMGRHVIPFNLMRDASKSWVQRPSGKELSISQEYN